VAEALEHAVISAMEEIVGANNVRCDAKSCRYFAGDLFFEAPFPPMAVVSPATRDEAVRVIQIGSDESVSIVPRGGGLSYTGGYVTQDSHSIILDTTRLTRIIEINEDDQYVTVEAGVTWQVLDDEVAKHGLRVPQFGPASGRVSTVGGGLSQNTILFGSATHGSVADHVLSLEVALADGSRINTGSGAMREGQPFFRYHGPDASGLFLGDCGAFGVKLSATLQLMPRPATFGFASFSFRTFEAMIAAQAEIGRTRQAADILGAGDYVPLHHDDTEAKPIMHVVVEGDAEADVTGRLERLRVIATHQGHEVEPTLPTVLRTQPFDFLRSLLGENGHLQTWTHALVPFSRGLHMFSGVTATLNADAALIERHGIDITISVAVVRNALLIEPIIRWRDQPRALHLDGLGGEADVWRGEPDPAAADAAAQIRRGLRDLFRREAAVHLQIGRFYAYREGLGEDSDRFLMRLKHALDPYNRMNPGALGLG
jgi:D-lactate dehydrogenase (cytochrome)